MSRFLFRLAALVVIFSSALIARAAEDAAPTLTPNFRYEVEYASGIFWKVGGGATPLSYTLAPQILSLKIPSINERPWLGGTLVMRSRFSLLLEPIVHGPEHLFVGLSAAGELEWRDLSRRYTVFFAAGGGFGWLDSKGYEVKGAQGQDFNLTWLANGGARYRLNENWQASLSLYFQHISNKGMNKVNPGLNALGPMFGISRLF